MLIDINAYCQSLAALWHKVFGDDYSFINLIFKEEYRNDIICFGEIIDDNVISAFYLIKNQLLFNQKSYSGYYLYAAATLPEYRGKGIMSELIAQAQSFCRKEGVDFITLLPSQKSLYSYYSRFGFQGAMHRIRSKFAVSEPKKAFKTENADAESIFEKRKNYVGNAVIFNETTFSYAYECMRVGGFKFVSLNEESYMILSDKGSAYEFICSDGSLEKSLSAALQGVNEILSPFRCEGALSNEPEPYGMLYPINKELLREWKITDIYMNLGLE